VSEPWRGIKPAGVWRLTDPPRPPAGGIYFVQGVDGGLVKIGRSADIPRRLWDLQASCPVPLRCLAVIAVEHPDGRALFEEELHCRFAEGRAHGEWFEPTAELLAVAAGERAVSVWVPPLLRSWVPSRASATPWSEERS
jgi:hypothetical protein